jgi:hypothetical protein
MTDSNASMTELVEYQTRTGPKQLPSALKWKPDRIVLVYR